jgi:general secretion pathway protein J
MQQLPKPLRTIRLSTSRGFTLIEVMVSLLILSVVSLMAWKGLDGIVRARDITEGSVQRSLRLQSVMSQWQADLHNVIDLKVVPALQFDGAVLRMTRRYQGGAQVVVWALRRGQWLRWAGKPVVNVGMLMDQWEQTRLVQQGQRGVLVAVPGVTQWQVYFFRNGSWSNAQSSGDIPVTLAQAAAGLTGDSLPMGVRVVVGMGPDSGMSGSLTRDVELAPQPGQQ